MLCTAGEREDKKQKSENGSPPDTLQEQDRRRKKKSFCSLRARYTSHFMSHHPHLSAVPHTTTASVFRQASSFGRCRAAGKTDVGRCCVCLCKQLPTGGGAIPAAAVPQMQPWLGLLEAAHHLCLYSVEVGGCFGSYDHRTNPRSLRLGKTFKRTEPHGIHLPQQARARDPTI